MSLNRKFYFNKTSNQEKHLCAYLKISMIRPIKSVQISLLCLCVAAGLCLSFVHGGHQAFFTIRAEGEQLSLVVKLEEIDITAVTKTENSCAPDLGLALCAQQYLQANFHCRINTHLVRPELESFVSQQGVLILKFSLPVSEKTVNQIEVQNTCFNQYTHDQAYESIVRFALAGQDKSFKMDRQRTQIIFKP